MLSSSRGAKSATLPQPVSSPKINSFEAALAEKGVTGKAALERSGTGSPRKEQYFADLNGHRITWAFFFSLHRWWGLTACFHSSLPETCEVNSPDIHDVLLAEDYALLPNLVLVFLIINMWVALLIRLLALGPLDPGAVLQAMVM